MTISHSEIAEWSKPEWLGRQLRSNDLVADVDLGRKRVYGKNLRLVRFDGPDNFSAPATSAYD
jgi:hypothetical protein